MQFHLSKEKELRQGATCLMKKKLKKIKGQKMGMLVED
jgi:hypothetical protein